MPGKGKPFVKGDKRAGRPLGRKSDKTIDQNLLTRAATWIDGQDYFDNVRQRITRGKAPHAESYILRRVHGDPTQHVEMTGANQKPLRVVIEVVRG
jgi:ribosomal protein L24E